MDSQSIPLNPVLGNLKPSLKPRYIRSRLMISLNFLMNNLDLLLIVFNMYVLSNTLTTESYYMPWRAILNPETDHHHPASSFSQLRLHYPYLANQTNAFWKEPHPWRWTEHAGDHAQYTAAGNTFMKLIPEYFDVAGAQCLDHAAASAAYSKVIPATVTPLAVIVAVILVYKFTVSRLWEHHYGSYGHIVVNVRNFVVYRILLIVVFITTVYALLLVAIINNGFADFDFMLCFVTSTVNIFIALNELRSHTDATLEVTDDADRVKVGNFKFWDKCTTVMEALEDGMMLMLMSGHDEMLTHELKITPEDCKLLKEVVMSGGVVERHSMRAFIASRGKSSTPAAIDNAKKLKRSPSAAERAALKFTNSCSALTKSFNFLLAQNKFLAALLNAFFLIWSTNTAVVETDFRFPQFDRIDLGQDSTSLIYANDVGEEVEISVNSFKLENCRFAELQWPNLAGPNLGGILQAWDPQTHDHGAYVGIAIASSIFLAVCLIAFVSEIHLHTFRTFGFVQSIADAPKDGRYRVVVIGVIVICFACAVYALWFENDTCAWWNTADSCNKFNWDTGPMVMSGWCNLANMLKQTLVASKIKLAHSPNAQNVPIPGMSLIESPSVIYELVQDGLLMYIAKGDTTILVDRLGMEISDIDNLVHAISNMEVYIDFYSGKAHVSHPDTKKKSAKAGTLMAKEKWRRGYRKQVAKHVALGGMGAQQMQQEVAAEDSRL